MKDQEFEYNPYEQSDFVSRILFIWCLKKFRNISRKGLYINTLFKVTTDQDSELLGSKLHKEWREEIKQAMLHHRKPCLYNVLSKMFIFNKENWLLLMWFLINYIIIRSSQAAATASLVQKLLYPLNDGFEFATQCVLAVLLTVIVVINALITNYCLYRQLISGIRLRTALTNLIFRKIMILDHNILTKTENIEFINFISLDLMDLDLLPKSIHYLFLLPVVPAEIYLMIYVYFNEAAIIGIGIFALSFPFQCLCCSWVYTINRSVEKHTQRKISIISTMLKYIYTVKIYGLEKLFVEKIWRVRKSKNKINGFNYFVRFLYIITLETTQRMAVFATVFFFIYQGYVLTIEKIVLCLVIFVDFGQTLIHNIPESIALVSNSKKFLREIQKFLLLEEHKNNEFILREGNIIFENVSASKNSRTLKDLNITIPSGKLSLVTGTNLSGHNLIIPILLSEIAYTGNVVCTGTFAYYHTQPIIISGTIKENITLGKVFSRKKYNAAVKIAGIKADILKLPYKEETDIYDADFSFLQKTQVNLARILYSNADIYLFLFPIIDIHNYVTARSSLIDCITNYLNNKTRIVVSNQLVFTEYADVIFYMNEGRCEHFGSFNSLKQLFPTLNEIMIADIDRRSSTLCNNSITTTKPDMKLVNSTTVQVFTDIKSISLQNPKKNIIKAYMTGWKLKNSMYTCIIITCIASFFCIAADYYIYDCADSWMKMFYTPESISSFKANKMSEPIFNKSTEWLNEEIENTRNDLINYTIIILLLLFFQVTRVLVCLVIFERASKKIFAHLMSAVMNSRLNFFVNTSSDDILRLFDRDIKVIDVNIPINVMDSVQC